MANVDVIISKAIITRTFSSPIVPGATEADPLPVNPDGLPSGSSTYIGLTDTDNTYLGKAGQIPIVNNTETGLEFGSVASATNHNDLASIQGGAVGEYYHLTEDEYDAILNTPNTATSLNPFATIADIGALGGGTVTSVSLTAPSIFSVSGSPVTTSGTLGLALANQSGFTVFARESGTGTPSFQALLEGHIPAIPISKVTGLQSALDLKLGVGLVSGNIFVGNASNIAAGVTLSLNATGGTFGLSNAGVLTFPNASGSVRGLLTSADWTTFNNKANSTITLTAGTGLTGGGDLTANRSFALTGQALALHNLATNGIIVRTGAGTVTSRTITAGAGISISNGDGVSGNPVITSTITQYTDALARASISLTVSGNSGASTYNSSTGVLNVPTYTLAGLGGVASTRNINSGTGLTGGGDLSADRILALTGQALALHNLATNGYIVRTGAGTVAGRTITAGTGISITNGDGVAGNTVITATGGTGTVTSVGSGTGLTGGPITTTGTLALTGQALALHNLATNGIIVRTGAGTVAGRTITGGTSISVTNGDGVAGNPTLSAIFGTIAGTVAQGNDSRFHNAVTIGTANGLSLATQVLSLALASTSTTGALSSTDWNTFNGKSNLALGETSTTAYRGDRGKIAYDYSQIGHLPLTGGTLTGNLLMNNVDGRSIIFNLGSQIRSATGAFVISSAAGTGSNIILRPNGDTNTAGQLRVNSDGTVDIGAQATATNHAVRADRSVLSGTGLTGGGNFTADRTLALTGQALALHNLATNGLIARTGAGTVAGRTITAGSGISVTDGNGVAGNPTISLNVANNVTGSGANERVAIWSGTNTVTSNSRFTFVDANGLFVGPTRLNGTSDNVTSILELGGSTNNIIRSTGFLRLDTNGANERARILSTGEVLLGTTTERTGGGRLQVNGAVNASQFYSEVITVTLPNDSTTFVTVKVFPTTLKGFIYATANPVPNVPHAAQYYVNKTYDGTNGGILVVSVINLGYVMSTLGVSSNTLTIRADAVATRNTDVKVTLFYYSA